MVQNNYKPKGNPTNFLLYSTLLWVGEGISPTFRLIREWILNRGSWLSGLPITKLPFSCFKSMTWGWRLIRDHGIICVSPRIPCFIIYSVFWRSEPLWFYSHVLLGSLQSLSHQTRPSWFLNQIWIISFIINDNTITLSVLQTISAEFRRDFNLRLGIGVGYPFESTYDDTTARLDWLFIAPLVMMSSRSRPLPLFIDPAAFENEPTEIMEYNPPMQVHHTCVAFFNADSPKHEVLAQLPITIQLPAR